MSARSPLEGVGPLQPFAKAAAGPFLRRYYRLVVEGGERLPVRGPVILAPNHDSMWDIPMLVVACPRPIVFMANEGVFDRPFKSWFFTRLGGFPVRSGGFDPASMRSSLAALREGRVLCLYPEGTRSPGRLLPFRPGVARLALSTGAPIVPAAILGTDRIWPRGSRYPRPARLTIRFGEPIRVESGPELADRKQLVAALTERVRERVLALLERRS